MEARPPGAPTEPWLLASATSLGVPVNDSPEDAYYTAGLSDEEVAALVHLATEAGSADPRASHIAVPAGDLRHLLAVVDRLCDQAAGR